MGIMLLRDMVLLLPLSCYGTVEVHHNTCDSVLAIAWQSSVKALCALLTV